jgi:ribonuclease Z
VLRGLLVVAPYLPFDVQICELSGLVESECPTLDELQITCVEAEHRVPCLAYRLDLPRAPRFQPDRARALQLPVHLWSRLQRGETIDGVRPEDVLGPPRRGLSVALVTDTRPTSAIADLVREVDLLVCEATFASDEDQPRAVERGHMTFREAAELAIAARAQRLVLSHFSPALTNPQEHEIEVREIFENATVGRDHLTLSLRFPEE